MSGYTKLFASIIHSTIWRTPHHIRIVWVTMMAMADKHGIVEASIPGLADAARVTISECEQALAHLMAPDIYSRSKEHEGRRIEEVDGGWFLLTHAKHRDRLSKDEQREKTRLRVAKHRANKASNASVTPVTESNESNDTHSLAPAPAPTSDPNPPPTASVVARAREAAAADEDSVEQGRRADKNLCSVCGAEPCRGGTMMCRACALTPVCGRCHMPGHNLESCPDRSCPTKQGVGQCGSTFGKNDTGATGLHSGHRTRAGASTAGGGSVEGQGMSSSSGREGHSSETSSPQAEELLAALRAHKPLTPIATPALAELLASKLGLQGGNKLSTSRVKLALQRVADKTAMLEAASGPRSADELTSHLMNWVKKPDHWWKDREAEVREEQPAPPVKPEPRAPEPTAEERAANREAARVAAAAFAKVGQPMAQRDIKPGKPRRSAVKHCNDCGKDGHATGDCAWVEREVAG